MLGQRFAKWIVIAEDHHWKYKAIRIQTQYCEAVDLLSGSFESLEDATVFFQGIEALDAQFQAFQSSILNSAFKQRISMCTDALRANFLFAIANDAASAMSIATNMLKQVMEDVTKRDNHVVYSSLNRNSNFVADRFP